MDKPVSKEKTIKIFLKILVYTIALTLIVLYLGYGSIPIKPVLTAFSIVLPFMIIGTFIGYKYQISKNKKIYYYIYIFLGSAMIIINGLLVIIYKNNFNYYIQIGAGLIFLAYGMKKIRSLV